MRLWKPKHLHPTAWNQGVLCALVLGGLLPQAEAQYQVFQWYSFEGGTVPPNAVKIAKSPEQSLHAVRLSDIPGMPPGFASGAAAAETERYALQIRVAPDPKDYHTFNTGLAAPQVLDRDQLGANGRALYQADFYIPEEGQPLPSLAVVAVEAPDTAPGEVVTNVTKPFYRFGLTLGKTLYFSCVLPRQKTAALYHNDAEFLRKIPKPGWHRFAIVMEGPETIRCFVDGREPSFSPIQEKTLRKLIVGVMVADKERAYDAYADNISIQVSQDAPILPQSPYQDGWSVAAASAAAQPGGASGAAAIAAAPSGDWLVPQQAWQRAQAEKKPLLLYFYAPGVPATQRIDQVLTQEPAAADFLRRHAAARVDVNQLQGGTIAKQYEVFKVPTLLVISADQKAYRRVIPGQSDPWEKIAAQLTLP